MKLPNGSLALAALVLSTAAYTDEQNMRIDSGDRGQTWINETGSCSYYSWGSGSSYYCEHFGGGDCANTCSGATFYNGFLSCACSCPC